MLQNPTGETGALFYSFGATPDGTPAGLAPGQCVKFIWPGAVPTEAINVAAADTGHKSW
jgi:hypothetical protein